jgi:hypothetical protein
MPTVKGLNTKDQERVASLLDRGAARIEDLQGELAELATERDKLIREAVTQGMSRRQIAAAARLTAGRVQQIVGKD